MIEVKNLYKIYAKSEVLKNINLKINRGEVVILKGVSGSGKTTLLSIIAGLDKPSSGAVFIENEPISKLPDLHLSKFRKEKIGIVFQNFNLIDYLSVYENMLAKVATINKDFEQEIFKALEFANIKQKANQIVSNLSGGEKQRVAIARAILNNPDIILCDEPTANLDSKNSQIFINLIKKLKEQNKTIIIATHDPIFENLDFVNKIVNLVDGKIKDE
jgi:putative ABC transport system ATP-binding protein